MSLNLQQLIPPYDFRIDSTGDLERFIGKTTDPPGQPDEGILQPVLDLLWDEHLRWRDQADVDLADEDSVNAMLADLGNPFSVALGQPLNRRRLLVRVLVDVYRTKGTATGLRDVIRALTGLEIVRIISPATLAGFTLGVHVLSQTGTPLPTDPNLTDLGFLGSGPGFVRFSFQIEVDRVLTSDEQEILTEIVQLVKPAHTHFMGFVQPTVGGVVDHWELSLSFLHKAGEALQGDETTLH